MATKQAQEAAVLAWARGVATQYHTLALRHEKVPLPLEAQYRLARKLVFTPLHERIDLAVRQIEALSALAGERNACLEARHHVPWYLHGVAYAGYYRQQLVHVETLEELRRIADGIKRDLR